MSVSCFAQPVSDVDELQVRAGALPENTKARTDWGIRVWDEWASSRVASEHDGDVAVTTALLEMPPADLAYWMGKFCVRSPQEGWTGVPAKEYLQLGMLL